MIEDRFKRSPEKLEELKSIVVDSKAAIANHNRQKLEMRWHQFYELYRGSDKRGHYKGRANLDWASAFLAIEIIAPRLFQNLFPQPKWFGVKGQERTDDKQASIIETYMKRLFDAPICVRKKMISYIRYLCIYGTLICKTPFRHEEKKVPTKTRNPEGGIDISESSIVTWDNIDLQLVDLYNFYPADDTIQNIEDQPFCIHAFTEPTKVLKQKEVKEKNSFGIYENLDQIRFKDDKGQNILNSRENVRSEQRMNFLGLSSKTYKHQGLPVYIDEFQGLVDLDGEEELLIITVANSNTVIQAETLKTPDMEKTYVKGVYVDVPNEFFGMPPHERSEKTIFELNDRANQTMDATSLVINPMYANSDADIVEGKLSAFPGRIIKTATEKGLTPLKTDPSILTPAYTAIQTLIGLIQDTTGATRFLGGSAQTPELQRTATGVLSIIKEANARIAFVIEGFDESFIRPFLRKAYKYTQFYATRKDVIRVTNKHGTEYVEFDPQTIIGDYDFIPMGAQSLGSEEIQTQQAINLLNILVKMPPEVLAQYDILMLIQRISEQMLGFEDAEEMDRTSKRTEEDKEKAITENQMFLNGLPAQAQASENHALHIQLHQGLLLDPRIQEHPNGEQVAALVQEHLQEHEFYKQLAGVQAINQAGGLQQPQGQGGVPAQEQPRGTSATSLTQQISQPSQGGTL